MSRSVSCEIPASPGKGQRRVGEGDVWANRRLLGYRIVKGRPLVLVPWVPTWEASDEYPEKWTRLDGSISLGCMADRGEGRDPISRFDSGRWQIGTRSREKKIWGVGLTWYLGRN